MIILASSQAQELRNAGEGVMGFGLQKLCLWKISVQLTTRFYISFAGFCFLTSALF